MQGCEEDSSFSGPFPCGSNVPVLFSSLAPREVPLLPGIAAVPKAAGTLDILGDTGETNLFMQVVLRDALSPLVTKRSLYCLSLASFSLILPLPFHTSRGNLSSTCFFPSACPGAVLALALESVPALQAGEKPEKPLAWMEGISHAVLALAAPVALRTSGSGLWDLRSSEVPLHQRTRGLEAASG